MSFFNKVNDVLIVDTFKQISQRRDIDIELFTSDAVQVEAFQQNVHNGKSHDEHVGWLSPESR